LAVRLLAVALVNKDSALILHENGVFINDWQIR